MSLSRDTDPVEEGTEMEFPRCSLPELYALVENLNKESKKSYHLKAHGISPSEAQEILSQNMNAMSLTSRTDVREDPQPVSLCNAVRKDEETPVSSMIDLLHSSLLTSSLSPGDRLSKSQQRLAQYGIPPPSHTFPYEILTNKLNSSPNTGKKSQRSTKLPMLSVFHTSPEKFTFEDIAHEYLLAEPEKQFMDLRDLEWKYYKGITTWKHKASDSHTKIPYNSEKRKGKTAKQNHAVYGEGAVTGRMCQRWFAKFHAGDFLLDKLHSGVDQLKLIAIKLRH